jgi:hypothetical protein
VNESGHVAIVVLNDGTTYTDVNGCSILIVSREEYDRVIQSGGDARDFNPIAEVALFNHTIREDA